MQLDRNSDVPLYLQARDLLTQCILDGEWDVGSPLPSEHDLCVQLGISRGTLRQALAELERQGFVRREQGRGTFVIRGYRQQDHLDLPNRTIAFVVPYVRDSFVPTLLLGVEHAAREHGYSVLFHHVENSLTRQGQVLEQLDRDGIRGIVLFPVDSVHVDPSLVRLAERDFPLVIVDRYLKTLLTDYVTADNFGGALRATQHLIGLGHRRIAFLTWKDPAVTMEHRRAGYEQALIEGGLSPADELIWEVEGYPTIDLAALCQFLQAEARPTAIFAANDQLALAVYRAAREMNLRIPEDLALVGFDDLNTVAHLETPLTTVAQPMFEMGRKATEVVIGRIAGVLTGPQRHILPTQLIVRRSCGAFRQSTAPVARRIPGRQALFAEGR